MAVTHIRRGSIGVSAPGLLLFVWVGVCGCVLRAQTPRESERAQGDLDSCRVVKVTTLPGSHEFAGDFIETIANDPAPNASDPDVVWGLTTDLSEAIPARERLMYISKSTDGGATWSEVAHYDTKGSVPGDSAAGWGECDCEADCGTAGS